MVDTKNGLPDVTENSPLPVRIAQKLIKSTDTSTDGEIYLRMEQSESDYSRYRNHLEISFDGETLQIKDITCKYIDEDDKQNNWELVDLGKVIDVPDLDGEKLEDHIQGYIRHHSYDFIKSGTLPPNVTQNNNYYDFITSGTLLPDVTENSPYPVRIAQKLIKSTDKEINGEIDVKIERPTGNPFFELPDELEPLHISFDGETLQINDITYKYIDEDHKQKNWELGNIEKQNLELLGNNMEGQELAEEIARLLNQVHYKGTYDGI